MGRLNYFPARATLSELNEMKATLELGAGLERPPASRKRQITIAAPTSHLDTLGLLIGRLRGQWPASQARLSHENTTRQLAASIQPFWEAQARSLASPNGSSEAPKERSEECSRTHKFEHLSRSRAGKSLSLLSDFSSPPFNFISIPFSFHFPPSFAASAPALRGSHLEGKSGENFANSFNLFIFISTFPILSLASLAPRQALVLLAGGQPKVELLSDAEVDVMCQTDKQSNS